MKGPGIFWMLQTAAGLSMAGPMFVVGIEFARTGSPVAGVGFFALGAIALYFPTYLVNRIGGPRTWIRRRFGGSDGDGDDEGSSRGRSGADAGEEHGGLRASVLDRLRNR
ncbi:hypothetical protein CV102_10925 [Natronococcus pandeyae]|uniref:Uncharacterized protein n=1 Tax=Natronococcus pandeyae TaxID=2055836 RepID=A0A8J8Q0U3_9EURY|nr:hypothetical protein [Natronococcus pandeyae]TYL38321.1 hypothetical protein CV102_10925 [Natronococcus pandeyae]